MTYYLTEGCLLFDATLFPRAIRTTVVLSPISWYDNELDLAVSVRSAEDFPAK